MQIGAVAEDRAKPAGRPGKRLEGDQLRLRPAGTRERAELTLVGADVDHGGGFDPDKRRPVLDRGDDGMRKRIPMAGVPRRAQRALKFPARSEESSVRKECVRKCRSRWSRNH